jgi:hypothetical protein
VKTLIKGAGVLPHHHHHYNYYLEHIIKNSLNIISLASIWDTILLRVAIILTGYAPGCQYVYSTYNPSTATAAAPAPVSALSSDTDLYYKSKWGKVAILTGDNYQLFEQTCKTALVVASAWNIVNRTEARPLPQNRALLQDYNKRLLRAIHLITNSVRPLYNNRINIFINTADPQGMWDELAKDNRVLDLVYQNSLYARFHREDWTPKNESLWSFVTRLESYRTELSGTNNQITDQQLVSRILQALPSDSVWQQAKLFALRENRDFPTTVTLLQTYKNSLAPTPSEATTTAIASTARDTHPSRLDFDSLISESIWIDS